MQLLIFVLFRFKIQPSLSNLGSRPQHFRFMYALSVYPPVKWEGTMDAVNRLPVDVAER